ncbi:MAG: hypothetical protein CMJ49_09765 [Planctomycetaceae bacterium]|nr:hypothetical protein [Planctomycetaceae bacterium]
MIRQPNILWLMAILISVALHTAVALEVRNLPFGAGDRTLFEQPQTPRPAIQIIRGGQDVIVDDTALADDPNATGPRDADDPDLTDVLEPMLNDLEAPLAALDDPPPPDTTPFSPSQLPAMELTPLADPTFTSSDQRDADTTARLLALADPIVAPPVFVSPTDGIDLAPPRFTVDPAAAVSPSELAAIGSTYKAGPILTGPIAIPGGSTNTIALPDAGLDPITPPVIPDALLTDPPPVIIETPLLIADPTAPEPVHLDDDFDYQLFVLPPIDGEPGYFEVRITPRRSLHRLKTLKRDVIFVIDTSESIGVTWINPIKAGVSEALATLNPDDRFNLSMFKETVSVLSPDRMLPANDDTFAQARALLNSAEPSGYTDVNRAVARMLGGANTPDRLSQIILISDGKPTRGALDPRRIINLITRENDLVAGIFCIGVGDDINRELLDFLAYRNKGHVTYADDWLQGAATIRDAVGKIRRPIMKDVAFRAVGVDPQTIFPRLPRDLYQSQPLRLFGRFDRADQLTMTLTGASGKQMLDFTFTLPFNTALPANKSLPRDWAFWKLHHLYSEMLRTGENRAIKRQIEQLQRAYKLETLY